MRIFLPFVIIFVLVANIFYLLSIAFEWLAGVLECVEIKKKDFTA